MCVFFCCFLQWFECGVCFRVADREGEIVSSYSSVRRE